MWMLALVTITDIEYFVQRENSPAPSESLNHQQEMECKTYSLRGTFPISWKYGLGEVNTFREFSIPKKSKKKFIPQKVKSFTLAHF